MPPSATIRAATTPAEIESVRTLMVEYIHFLLHHPTGSAHFSIGGIDAELAGLPAKYAPPGCLLLAEHDGQPLGCIAVRRLQVEGPMASVHQAEGAGLALELKRLWVRPQARGLQLGRRLLQSALAHCRAQGAVAAYLDTVPAAMPQAVRLYQELGFESTGRYNSNLLNGVAFYRMRLLPAMEPTQVTCDENPTN